MLISQVLPVCELSTVNGTWVPAGPVIRFR